MRTVVVICAVMLAQFSMLTPAVAAAPVDTASSNEGSRAFMYFRWISQCFREEGRDLIFSSGTDNWGWFTGGTKVIGEILGGDDDKAQCDQPANVRNAVAALGLGSNSQTALKAAGYTENGTRYSISNPADAIPKIEAAYFGPAGAGSLPRNVSWMIYSSTFFDVCQPTEAEGTTGILMRMPDPENPDTLVNKYYQPDESTYTTSASGLRGPPRTYVAFNGSPAKTCAEFATLANSFADGFALWARNNEDLANEDLTSIGSLAGTPGGGEGDITSTCGVEGIGWIVCPVMNFLARLNDLAFGILSSYFLEIETSLINDPATFRAWQAFRDIANALFLIAFLAIVYGQMVGGRN